MGGVGDLRRERLLLDPCVRRASQARRRLRVRHHRQLPTQPTAIGTDVHGELYVLSALPGWLNRARFEADDDHNRRSPHLEAPTPAACTFARWIWPYLIGQVTPLTDMRRWKA